MILLNVEILINIYDKKLVYMKFKILIKLY